ncbi:MAG: flagellar biosynthesis protein FlhF [Spirochaetes bacterium]|nr:flagellar biosynthesis protein FlhF [Spirochaetota bacterium]
MRYIKIRGNNYNEVMMKLKMEHGDDAIPISHKFVKEGGLFNSKFFAREVVELTAAVQERKSKSSLLSGSKKIDITVGDAPVSPKPAASGGIESSAVKPSTVRPASTAPAPPEPGAEDPMAKRPAGFTFNEKLNEVYNGIAEQHRTGETARPAQEAREQRGPASAGVRFEKDLEEIKRAIYRISGDVSAERNRDQDDGVMGPMKQVLKNNDYDEEQCATMISQMKDSISREDLKDRHKIEKTLKDLLKSRIVVTGPIKTGSRKKIIMFIGPTGVGKTTTMAKLGAINSLREGASVAFVTIDNYRIAATEQLKKYAEIMNIPIHAVNNQKEFKEVVGREKADIIMVDTSGRSHRNDVKISEIKSFADTIECDCEKILCVSANTKKADVQDVFRAFDSIRFDSIIITKVDETSYIGNVVDIADKYNKPIAYYTVGQEVPNDIVVADPDKIVDMMVGNVYN